MVALARAAGVSHLFNTGAVSPQRTLLQRGVFDVLQPMKRANGGYLQDVIRFGGIVRSYTDEPDIEILMKTFGRTPTIGVATGTRSFNTATVGGKNSLSECELLLYFSTQHSRDLQVGRMETDSVAQGDDTADPGLHVIMEHAIELMHGSYPTDPDGKGAIRQLQIMKEEELATLPEITIWLQTYKVIMQTLRPQPTGWRTAAQLLASIGWRTTTEQDEDVPPAAQTAPTSIDANTEV